MNNVKDNSKKEKVVKKNPEKPYNMRNKKTK